MTSKKNACSNLKWLQGAFATFAIPAVRAAESLLLMPRKSAQSGFAKNKTSNCHIHLIAALLLLGFPLLATAQEATVIGTVTDPSGAIVVDVQITLTNVDTGLSKTTASNAEGQYVIPNLQIGHYAIKAQAKGFKAA